jgi:dynamin 1-like protein
VLESIVGLDFLPRGDELVTCHPLELRLCHILDREPLAVFAEKPEFKYTNFNKVRMTFEELTDNVCESDMNIVNSLIILNVYSPICLERKKI